jgi:Ca-activated chloride channel family protein
MKDSFAAVKKAVSGFAEALLRHGDQFFLMTFSFEPSMRLDWSRDTGALEPALERVEPDGGTSLHDAVVRSLEPFRSQRGRKAVVLLTDGDDTSSRTGWDVALRYARTVRTPIFPIGFKISKLDFFVRERLKDLAAETGGDVFFVPATGELADVYGRISEQLRSQYLVSYRSPSTKGPDHFREVAVVVKKEGLTARTISGYFPAM